MKRRLTVLLQQHSDALACCRRCGHADGVTPIVSSARVPRIVLVGQAPGKMEATNGRPFAGRAGGTLFRWLASIGLDEQSARRRIYIAAITRCYPGPSPSGRGDRVPSPRERDLCASWLDEELRLIRPSVLIPVGRLAIDRFLGPHPLDLLIGRAHDVEHVGGRSLAIPLPHPSGASGWIHEPGHGAQLHSALELLRQALAKLDAIPRRQNHRSVA
jgi:uracil-DNA glycosylase